MFKIEIRVGNTTKTITAKNTYTLADKLYKEFNKGTTLDDIQHIEEVKE